MSDADIDFDVVAFGAVNLDYLVTGPTHVEYIERMDQGDERRVDAADFDTYLATLSYVPEPALGGSAANTIRAVAALAPDLRLGLVAAVPADSPDLDACLGSLPADVTQALVEYRGTPGRCLSVVQGGDRKLVTSNDTAGIATLWTTGREQVLGTLERARVVHISSVFHDEAPARVADLLDELRHGRERRAPLTISVDPGMPWASTGLSHLAPLLRHADIVFLNTDELAALVPGEADVETAAGVLASDVCKRTGAVVVLKRRALFDGESDGPDVLSRVRRTGASFFPTRHGTSHQVVQEALPALAVSDSTGAGDVFAAGVLAAMYSPHVRIATAVRVGNAAARRKMQDGEAAYDTLRTVLYDEALPASTGPLFVSHAFADLGLVWALRELLVAGGVTRERIYCTSLEGQHAGPGTAFAMDLWSHLRAAQFALFVVTDAFHDSDWCKYEVGVASALRIPSVPLLGSGFTFDDLRLPINEFRGGMLTDLDFLRMLATGLADQQPPGGAALETAARLVVAEARARPRPFKSPDEVGGPNDAPASPAV